MFKILKKYSKLLALALVFSSSIRFSLFATAPQEPNKPTATQAQKREREECSSEEYNISGLVGMFNFKLYPNEVRPRCGLLMKYSPCNRRTSRFYLLPDYNHNVIAIGQECLRKNFGPEAHKNADSRENTIKYNVTRKILNYFLQNNWHENFLGNYVLNLTPLLEDPDLKGVIKGWVTYFTIFVHSENTKKNPHPYDMAYNGAYINRCNSFDETYTIADKKFAAFCYFCKINEIL